MNLAILIHCNGCKIEKHNTVIMIHTAIAHWSGNYNEDMGSLTMRGMALNGKNQHINEKPEELLAAAHASCFTLAVASMLSQKGIIPELLDTQADLTLVGKNITAIHLSINGRLDNISAEDFATITREAEKNCLISKILNIPITSEVHFII